MASTCLVSAKDYAQYFTTHQPHWGCERYGHRVGRNIYTGERKCFRCGTSEAEIEAAELLPTAPEAQP